MASLLTYLGVLTLAGSTPLRELLMRIPNLVVRKLYVERIQETLLPDGQDRDAAWAATRILFQSGDLQPVCDLVEQRYFPIFDNRDYRWANELTLKTAFLTLLFDDRLYVVDSETAIGRSHADLSLIRRPELWQQPQLWDFLLEFKLLKLREAGITGEEARQTGSDGPGGAAGRAGQAGRGPIPTSALSDGVGGDLWRDPAPAHLCGGGAGLRAAGVGGST